MMKDVYKTAFRNTAQAFKQLLFYKEDKCEICNKDGDIICTECAKVFLAHDGVLCEKCGRQIKNEGLCFHCAKYERPYEQGIISLFYQDKAKQVMSDFKFHSQRLYASFFAREIYNKIGDHEWEIDMIIPIPMHIIKKMGKGFNPPSLIARELSHMMKIDMSNKALKRKRHTKSMSVLKNIDRMTHSMKNFKIGKVDIKGKNILIIDDVSTTGATLHVCSQILKDNGANLVYVVAACGDSTQNNG